MFKILLTKSNALLNLSSITINSTSNKARLVFDGCWPKDNFKAFFARK